MVANFVSVSGISSMEELDGIGKICSEEEIKFPLAIGYQVASRVIHGGAKGKRQPRFAELGDLTQRTVDLGFIPVIHYYTKTGDTLFGDLEMVANVGVDPSSAFIQLNTLPLSRDELMGIREQGYKIIFKVAVSNKRDGGYAVWKGEAVQDVSSGDASVLVDQVAERKDAIDYAMFDPSHGTNLDLDLGEDSVAVKFGKEIVSREDLGHLGLVYAGGIRSGNVVKVNRSLSSLFPGRFSIDIESGVITNDRFNLKKTRDYLVDCKSTAFT